MTRWSTETMRPGFSLIELLLAMSVGSTVMVLSVGLVHRTLLNVSAATLASEHQSTMNRLVQSFRDDVHRATDADVVSPRSLSVTMSDGTEVTYQCVSNVVHRRQRLDKDSVRRESFSFLERTQIKFESLESPRRISLNASRETGLKGRRSVIDRHAEAVIGRMKTFERGVAL